MNIHNLPIPVLGFAAYSGTGKTTLLKQIVTRCHALKLRVGVIKHTHHHIELESPSKDSYQLRKAGAKQTLLVCPERCLLTTETPIEEHQLLQTLTQFDVANLDIIFVEGCKNLTLPKIELHRQGLNKPFLYPLDTSVIAIASDETLTDLTIPSFNINDIDSIIEFVLAQLGHHTPPTMADAAGFLEPLNTLEVSASDHDEFLSPDQAGYRIDHLGHILFPEQLMGLPSHTPIRVRPKIGLDIHHYHATPFSAESLLSSIAQHNIRIDARPDECLPQQWHISLYLSCQTTLSCCPADPNATPLFTVSHPRHGFSVFQQNRHFIVVSNAQGSHQTLLFYTVVETLIQRCLGLTTADPLGYEGVLTDIIHTPFDETTLLWGHYQLHDHTVTPVTPDSDLPINVIIDIPRGRDVVKPTERVTFYPIQGRIGL